MVLCSTVLRRGRETTSADESHAVGPASSSSHARCRQSCPIAARRDKRRYEPGIGRSKLSVATTERQDRHPEVRIAVRHGILGQEAARFPEPRGIHHAMCFRSGSEG